MRGAALTSAGGGGGKAAAPLRPAAGGARPLFSTAPSGGPPAAASPTPHPRPRREARCRALLPSSPPRHRLPLLPTVNSRSPDCIINVNEAASVSCAGSLGLLLCDTYTGILTRESSITTGVENQPVRDSFQMPRKAERLQDCFIKDETPNTSLCKTRDLRNEFGCCVCAVKRALARPVRVQTRTYSTRVQTPFSNQKPGRKRPGPKDTSPRCSV
ncbi:uncharacterized protein LOC107506632 isoform X2 [Rousettus aegyptiacus]|uniref:Uncharacterized protein n=1 Tax=Rousettus aegyptiacus TaxID=9407 RepID=A0A7J8IMC6_ROUAE|nr:uncharacterized protein LOC107506632 isoform X2 [Rousettus aegyptiacus]KAF6485299.1 hypothetical protein HJG63_010540 [Rousettus aegyptiacus]